MRRRKNRYLYFLIIRCVIWIGMTLSAAILVWPSFMNARCGIEQVSVIGGYEAGIRQKTRPQQEALLAAAQEYNQQIARKQKERPFAYTPTYEDAWYDSILRVSEDSTVMGYVEAPTGRVYLPIAHGTSDGDLEFEAGHLYGTSVPVGGPSTHAVIAAHTGLTEADLFTHLVDMREGDEFYIHVLGEKLIYTVDDIRVVLPEDGNDFLQVEEGEDYVTLYTCTPYGINSHRLLVRGRRTGTAEKEVVRGSRLTETIRDERAFMAMVLWGLVPVTVFVVGAFITFHGPKNNRRKT